MTLARDPKQRFPYVIGWSSPGWSSCGLSSSGSGQSSFPTTTPTARFWSWLLVDQNRPSHLWAGQKKTKQSTQTCVCHIF